MDTKSWVPIRSLDLMPYLCPELQESLSRSQRECGRTAKVARLMVVSEEGLRPGSRRDLLSEELSVRPRCWPTCNSWIRAKKDMTCIFTTVVLADMTGAYEQLSKSMFHSSVGFGLFDVVKRDLTQAQ